MNRTHLGLVLLVLLSLLLGLSLGDGSRPLSSTDLGGLTPPGSNGGEVSTDDTTLVLHGTAGTLLGNLLRDTLLVHATVHLGPGDLTGVLALEEKRLILGVGETEDLGSDMRRRDGNGRQSVRTLLSPRTKRRPLLG